MYTIRRWKLFFGFFTFILTLNAITLAVLKSHLIAIPIGLIAGLLIDSAYHFLRPSLARKEHFRILIALVPTIWLITYTIVLSVVYGSVWSMHMLVGSVVVTGMLAWLISGLMYLPPLPTAASLEEQ
ncbi:hypothetical protein EPA93_48005 [Ktedonosporobacter rubrisoli]|uniref:Uncharacterized protein n=1 Tax=Ktedonosporobacter rubrisoli TaxID=2509675 RepID=A0A4P6K4W5_KTERU|nr:hypothetical protein [Ktedonosporobacter rubrisoli]QBD83299.1 hypothetical protein EPA93_48005 [Ktedonosporobacter rubrisoli]